MYLFISVGHADPLLKKTNSNFRDKFSNWHCVTNIDMILFLSKQIGERFMAVVKKIFNTNLLFNNDNHNDNKS